MTPSRERGLGGLGFVSEFSLLGLTAPGSRGSERRVVLGFVRNFLAPVASGPFSYQREATAEVLYI